MSDISVALIVRNEERFITQCLESVKPITDDIVVVDTGSEDRTIELAEKEGARVISRPWPRDFARARNWAIEEAKNPWILMLDADEVLLEDDQHMLIEAVKHPTADAYNIRIVSLTDRPEDLTEARVTRVFRNDPRIRWEGRVHEQIIPSIGRAGMTLEPLDVRLMHYGYLKEVMTDRNKLERNLDLLDQSLSETKPNEWKAYLHWQRAQTLVPLERYDDAIKDMRLAMTLAHPTAALQPLFWLTLAKIFTAKRDYHKVHQTVREALKLFPDYTDLVYWEGQVFLDEGLWDKAEQRFKKALAMGVPKNYLQSELGVGTFKALWQLARISRMQGKMTQAEAYYLKTIELKPAFYPAWKEYLALLDGNPAPIIVTRLSMVLPKDTIIRTISSWASLSMNEQAILSYLQDTKNELG
ncbi:MAG: glycosyl transferase family 2 [Sulfobacillus thermosulfidooxidans]|uniref:Glycosyl transferase family 2 n=1 Tax=Sulfobacillus thermosulfidooxidans TaxID=28034 RepID=A0A2T2X359_SULTH|nr:MAG: glycosyl transferase family 2 [Sulfobacillus thermosulfidooxidans]